MAEAGGALLGMVGAVGESPQPKATAALKKIANERRTLVRVMVSTGGVKVDVEMAKLSVRDGSRSLFGCRHQPDASM
jgi:hypothetical protein